MRTASVTALRSYVGTPFAHMGRNAGGLDCAGLLYIQRMVCGFEPVNVCRYGRGIHGDAMAAILSEFMAHVPAAQYEVGDALWYRVRTGRPPSHLLIVSSPDDVIHAHWRRGVVEHGFPQAWASRIECAWRFIEWAG